MIDIDTQVKFWRKDDYIHQYYVEGIHDKLQECLPIDYLEKEYNQQKEGMNFNNIANFKIDLNRVMWLDNICRSIIQRYYLVDKYFQQIYFMAYYQSSSDNRSIWHSHIDVSTILATIYINPTKEGEGGELELFHPFEGPMKIQPEKDQIYVFPSWMLHRPLPQTREEPRICLNWGYVSSMRPIHKLTADRW